MSVAGALSVSGGIGEKHLGVVNLFIYSFIYYYWILS